MHAKTACWCFFLLSVPGFLQSQEQQTDQRALPPTGGDASSQARRQEPKSSRSQVFKASITPHWFNNNSQFWYRNDLAKGGKEFVIVDVTTGSKRAAFDHMKLAVALSKAAGQSFAPDRLPFESIEFLDAGKSIRFQVGSDTWRFDAVSGECTKKAVESPTATKRPDSGPPPSAVAAPPPKAVIPKGSERRAEPERKTEQPAKLALRDLLSRDANELQAVAERYKADRGSLSRTYPHLTSPTRHIRLARFGEDWLAALGSLRVETLSDAAREERFALRKRIMTDLRELDKQARDQAEIAPLVPFAPAVLELDELRRRMEKVDPAKAAHVLNDTSKQVTTLRKSLESQAKKAVWSKKQVDRAAETTRGLRTVLKSWHGFYDGYDPLLTWWASEPYQRLDQCLKEHAEFLPGLAAKNPELVPSSDVSEVAPLPQVRRVAGPSDVPNLQELLAQPRSEMIPVIQKYQSDRGGLGRVPGKGGAGRSPERLARLTTIHRDWKAALGELEFAKLSRPAQVEFLLLKTHIDTELRRFELQSREGPPPAAKPRDDSGIVGRPIGRDALLIELAGEMIPYSPEELLVLAKREMDWCEAQIKRAAQDMGFGDNWHGAVEKVKTLHVAPGGQPSLIRELAVEAIGYLHQTGLVTVPPLAIETWRMEMMTPQRQLVSPFFTGGEVISVSFPTNTMAHEAKLQSLRGNNIHFARATVQHELIPGHHLQGFMTPRYQSQRSMFGTAFWTEGWAVWWEMLLYDRGFPRTPEDRVGMLVWRLHRCARVMFSLGFHLGQMTPRECIDLLVRRVGFEPDNATAEVRRSFGGGYGPLYQCAYLLGAFQFRDLHTELVGSGKMSDRAFHDAILVEGRIPIAMVRAILTKQLLTPDFRSTWRFGPTAAADSPVPGR